jgi:16S rRNA (adenine1518-N6/adenine1519-N6)-dimethyltransferase
VSERPDLTKPTVLRAALARHGLVLSRRYGQNFLVSRAHLDKVIAAADLGPDDTVFEIGPGAGTLTVELAQRAGAVIAIELDRGILPLLYDTVAGCANVRIVEGDALKMDWDALLPETGIVRVAANIPYNITSPLLVALLEHRPAFASVTLMVQKEVAQRLVAAPGTSDYGALTVFTRFHAQVRLVAAVPRGVFFPPPKVDSAVVHLVPHAAAPVSVARAEHFFAVSRAAFAQRRKMLIGALTHGLNLPRERVQAALSAAGIDGERRGETLDLPEFAAIARAVFDTATPAG